MISTLWQALRLGKTPRMALIGAGGKSTCLFRLARELDRPVLLAATAHLALKQAKAADRHIIIHSETDFPKSIADGATLFTGIDNGKDRWSGLPSATYSSLHQMADNLELALLMESDGSRCRPAKAWEDYEPPIPKFTDTVVICAGLSVLGKPLDEEFVFRSPIFSRLSGLAMGEKVSAENLATVLAHPDGGIKNILQGMRSICLLNQADTPELQAQAFNMAQSLIKTFQAVLITSLKPGGKPIRFIQNKSGNPTFSGIYAVVEKTAAVILAAGDSSRMGKPKLILPWKGEPLIRHSVRSALQAGLDPVIVVTGAEEDSIRMVLEGLPVILKHNPLWVQGQSASVKYGLSAVPGSAGSVLFLLGDQPQIPATLMRALVEKHQQTLAPITCPMINQMRANPVLFDRSTFDDFCSLTGDSGARQLFKHYSLDYLPWVGQELLLDVDTPQDYEDLSQK